MSDGTHESAFADEDLGDPNKLREFCILWRKKFVKGVGPEGNQRIIWINLQLSIWNAMRLMDGAGIPIEPTLPQTGSPRTAILQSLDAVIDWCDSQLVRRGGYSPITTARPSPPEKEKIMTKRPRVYVAAADFYVGDEQENAELHRELLDKSRQRGESTVAAVIRLRKAIERHGGRLDLDSCFFAICEYITALSDLFKTEWETPGGGLWNLAYGDMDDFAAVEQLYELKERLDAWRKRNSSSDTDKCESLPSDCVPVLEVAESALGDYLEQLPAAATAPPKKGGRKTAPPKKSGRKKADYETTQREAEIAADWQQARESGEYKANFAKSKEMTQKDFDRLLDRVAARKRASEK